MSKNKEMADFIQIENNYRITSDGRQNLILHEKTEVITGRGKNAKKTGEFEYRPIGFFRKLSHIGSYLVRLKEFEGASHGFEHVLENIEELEKSIMEAMDKVSVTWASDKNNS